jgi:hypothetical protein
MSSEDSDSSAETDTDSLDETDTDESASDSSAESQLKPSDIGDVNSITPLSTNDHVRTLPLELPVCTTSKQMSLPSSSETSCHNPIFEQIIKKLNIVANGVKTTKFEV